MKVTEPHDWRNKVAKNRRKMTSWLLGILILFMVFVSISIINLKGILKPGNGCQYSVAQTEVLANSPLSGKTIYFLGSSITQGFASFNESFVDYLQKRDNCICVKEAMSGTTLRDNGNTHSYIQRMYKLNKKVKIDAFICQLSTNDTRFIGVKKLGGISKSYSSADFDTATTTGAIEYIISYARETWNLHSALGKRIFPYFQTRITTGTGASGRREA